MVPEAIIVNPTISALMELFPPDRYYHAAIWLYAAWTKDLISLDELNQLNRLIEDALPAGLRYQHQVIKNWCGDAPPETTVSDFCLRLWKGWKRDLAVALFFGASPGAMSEEAQMLYEYFVRYDAFLILLSDYGYHLSRKKSKRGYSLKVAEGHYLCLAYEPYIPTWFKKALG